MGNQTRPHQQTSFAELLRRYRAAQGLTQEELAERAELSVRGLRYLEHGIRRPYRDTADRLAQALTLSPNERQALIAAARPGKAPPPTEAERSGESTIPLPPGPIIGREREVRDVITLLRREDVRLLTLTGTGGVGKTRLAVEVAARLLAEFVGGVAWVPLGSLADSELVLSAIAQALRLMETGTSSLFETLTASLRDRQLLLLLDNFEQVVAAAPVVAELVARCPRLKVLVTSRAALRLRSEHEFPVAPLRPPDETQGQSVYALATNPAVDLFLRRAQAVTIGFALTDANAHAVAAICRRLEGLPLALELAAARIRVSPPEKMLPRLERRLAFLTGGALDLPARQRTMRETIAWSYDLLNPAEQMHFRRLAVFAGGADIAAIEAVCNGTGDLPTDVLDAIEALQRSSLLQLDETSHEEPRFVMLETVREYALERLVEAEEEDELRRRHAAHYVEFVEEGAGQFFSPSQGLWLDRLEQEHDNLRAALRWCIEQREAELGLRLTAVLWMLWYVRGYSEGPTYVTTLLALAEATTVMAPRTGSLLGAGQLAIWKGDYTGARTFLQESIAICRALRDERGMAEALLAAGFAARVHEEYETARALLEEALARSRAIGHRFIVAAALHHLAMVAIDAQQDYDTARSLLEESLANYRVVGSQRFVGLVLCTLGNVVRVQRNYARSRGLLRQGLASMIEAGEKLEIPSTLDAFAHLAADEGEHRRAARLSGAAARLRDASGTQVWPVVERSRQGWLASARVALGEEEFGAEWTLGQTMSSEQAIACALNEDVVTEETARNGDDARQE